MLKMEVVVKNNKTLSVYIAQAFLLVFTLFTLFLIINILRTGEVSLCRGPIRTFCSYKYNENPLFFIIGLSVYLLIAGLIGYSFIKLLKIGSRTRSSKKNS